MNKLEAINKFLFEEVPNIAEIIAYKKSYGSKLDLTELINTLSKDNYNLATDMKASRSAVHRFVKEIFPGKGNEKLCNYLFNKHEYKYCPSCKQVLEKSLFAKDYCRSCYKDYYSEYMPIYYKNNKGRYAIYRAEYDEHLRRATPKWASLSNIRKIYDNCPDNMQVDHYYPIRGETVCGLHVENNLQYLTPKDNLSKGNKIAPVA